MTKKISFLSAVVLAGMLLSSFLYKSNFPNPGSDDSIGWWGWYDQGVYLQQMVEIQNEGLSKSKEQVYPPSYMVLSIATKKVLSFIGIDKTNGESIFLTNQFLVFLTFLALLFNLSLFRAIFFLLYLFFLAVFSSDVAGSLYVPWSSTVTLLCCVVLYQLYHHREALLKLELTKRILISFIAALLLSITFHSRPQDFALISSSLAISVMIESRKGLLLLFKQILIYLLVCFVLFELAWFYFADGLALGNIYTKSSHSFVFNFVPEKLYGVFVSDYRYGDFSYGFFQKSPLLFISIILPLVFSLCFGTVFFKVYFFLWVILYLSFSDFGPHNFLNFLLFHYFKTVFILSIYESCRFFSLNKIIKSSTFVVFLLFIPVSYSYSVVDSFSSFYAGDETSSVTMDEELNIRKGDVYFIRNVKFKDNISAHHALFQNVQIKMNNDFITYMRDYRAFAASDGIYIHFFTDFYGVKTISMSEFIKPSSELADIILYKAERVLW